jgi:hypothetical protein
MRIQILYGLVLLACTSFAYTDIISNSKLVTLLVIYMRLQNYLSLLQKRVMLINIAHELVELKPQTYSLLTCKKKLTSWLCLTTSYLHILKSASFVH